MGFRYVVHADVRDAAECELFGKVLRDVRRIAVHRAEGDDDTVLFRRVGAPVPIFIQNIGDVFGRSPNRTVERGNRIQGQPREFFQCGLYLRTELADDVGVIASRLVFERARIVGLIGKNMAVDGPEGAERIGREQRAGRSFIRYGDFRPVYHRHGERLQRMSAEADSFAFFYLGIIVRLRLPVKLLEELECRLIADESDGRIAFEDFQQGRAVIGFHMVDEYVVELPSVEQSRQVVEKLRSNRVVYGVDDGCFVVIDEEGVVADALRNRKQIFKSLRRPVVAADPVNVFRYLLRTVHGTSFPARLLCGQSSKIPLREEYEISLGRISLFLVILLAKGRACNVETRKRSYLK